jgi:hypothetical protein
VYVFVAMGKNGDCIVCEMVWWLIVYFDIDDCEYLVEYDWEKQLRSVK